MGFTVLPALIPDISSVYDVYFSAFASTPILSALFPSATTTDLTDPNSEFREAHTAHTLSYWRTSATQYTLKCVDSNTGKVVGMALWDVYVQPSDWKKGGVTWLAGKEKERAEGLLAPLWEARERMWDEKRYVYCHVMAVHPDFQKQSIGTRLTEAGILIAQQAELPIYLESSKEGVRMYEKLGFRRLKDKVIHSKEFLEEAEDHEVPLMVWVPKGKHSALPKGLHFE